MTNPALTLLHAPSTYDFRRMTILRGPISDLVPSSSIFEMYPMGFTSIANYLEEVGYPVRIVNLAARMLQDDDFDVEKFVRKLKTPLIFGMDLHWLPHAHGTLEIARIVKRLHPDVPIMLGGFSATYFHESIMRDYPEVDFIMRGDSTEEALHLLMQTRVTGDTPHAVPNLTWRDEAGKVHINPTQCQPASIDHINYDFRRLMISSIRDRDLESYVPFQGWLNYPIMPAVSCRGCVMNCVGCGGSASAFAQLHGCSAPRYRSPEKLAQDIYTIASVSNAPVFIIGDIRQAGREHWTRFLSAIRGIRTPVILELFTPANAQFISAVAEAIPNFAVELSIESHDPEVRHAYGKPYSNEQVEATIRHILDGGAQRLDLFFMTGLPKQTYASVVGGADYADSILSQYSTDGRIRPFIGPMAPFVDPGSRAFEHPDEHGYKLFYKTFEEHRQALLEPSWQFTLNYETKWMSRHDIVHSTYDACLRFAELKARYNLLPQSDATRVINTLLEGKALANAIERHRQAGNQQRIETLRPRIEAVNGMQGVEEDKELRLMTRLASRFATFKWSRVVWLLLKSWWHAQRHHPTQPAVELKRQRVR
jgi:B12-binding domain/radical SAM domain protein